MKFSKGDTITNGSSAGTVMEIVDKLPHWKAPGYRLQNVPLELFGGGAGLSSELPEYLASDWRKVPFEWTPVQGYRSLLEERYVWTSGYRRLEREVRQIEYCHCVEQGYPGPHARSEGCAPEVGVPRCPVDGQWCSTCRIGMGNGTGGKCARQFAPDASAEAGEPVD
jgi:hypothetical protein